MRDFEQSIIINEKIKLEERFEFRTIFSEEAVQAASVERVCFPPNEACTEEMFFLSFPKRSTSSRRASRQTLLMYWVSGWDSTISI